MTDKKPATKTAAKTASRTKRGGFSAEERAAMKERAQELQADGRRGSRSTKKQADEKAVLEAIAEMPDADRVLAEKIHAVVTANAPDLDPRLWYGMPAYAKDGKVVCFFQRAEKYTTRYASFGFEDVAAIDDGTMWPTAFALTKLTAADEATLAALVKRSVG